MPQQIGWSVESKLLYEIKQLTRQLSGRQYILTFPNFASFPTPGITGTLYVDESTGDIYVWNGTAYTLLSAGITALNGLIAAAQLLVTGSTGTDFNISSVGTTHTFNIPTASATNRGLLSSANWTTFNNKQNAITLTTTGTSGAATLVGSTLNIPQYQSVLTNPVTGTGTTNYVPKFTASATIGNSQIFSDANGVGIGITDPASYLTGGRQLVVANTSGAAGTTIRTSNTGDGSIFFSDGTTGDETYRGYVQYIHASDALRFGTSATERLRITSGGNVGINDTNPTDMLVVNGRMRVNGTNRITFGNSSGGYAGIGITGATTGNLTFNTFDGTSDAERLRITSDGDILYRGTYNPLSAANRGNIMLNGSASNIIGFSNNSALRGYIFHTDSDFQFYNNTTGGRVGLYTEATARLWIQANGRVGVNTTTDAGYQFDINGTLRSVNGANFATTSGNVGINRTSTGAKLDVQAESGAWGFFLRNNVGNTTIAARNDGRFLVGNGTVDNFAVTETGNVGIGTASPGVKLDVTGDVRASGSLVIGAGGSTEAGAIFSNANFGFWFKSRQASPVVAHYQFGDNSGNSLAMINPAGELLINTTSDAGDYKLQVSGNIYNTGSAVLAATGGDVLVRGTNNPLTATNRGNITLNGTASNIVAFTNGSTATGYLFQSTADMQLFNNTATGNLSFYTNAALAGRFTPAGEFLLNTDGTDAGDYKLQVVGNQYLSGKLVVGTTTDSGHTAQINGSLRLIPTSTVPTASAGTLYYDTATNKLKLYDGTSWVDLN